MCPKRRTSIGSSNMLSVPIKFQGGIRYQLVRGCPGNYLLTSVPHYYYIQFSAVYVSVYEVAFEFLHGATWTYSWRKVFKFLLSCVTSLPAKGSHTLDWFEWKDWLTCSLQTARRERIRHFYCPYLYERILKSYLEKNKAVLLAAWRMLCQTDFKCDEIRPQLKGCAGRILSGLWWWIVQCSNREPLFRCLNSFRDLRVCSSKQILSKLI